MVRRNNEPMNGGWKPRNPSHVKERSAYIDSINESMNGSNLTKDDSQETVFLNLTFDIPMKTGPSYKIIIRQRKNPKK